MKGLIEPAKPFAKAKQRLVDYFTGSAYRFSLSDPVTIALYRHRGGKYRYRYLNPSFKDQPIKSAKMENHQFGLSHPQCPKLMLMSASQIIRRIEEMVITA